ncbi:MAG: type II toxin-antitoxin system RelE/ParE family toxin [Armatimonadota bacterium]|nr:type II toxin-antitoxin system RelE/ParE family toxin [Armatimonadota bacterium]
MDYKVDFKDPFLEDLERIVREIAAVNAEAARRLGDTIVTAGEALAFFPERHPRVRQRPNLRRYIVARHYKVFYRIQHAMKTVEILRCWDGRRGAEPEIE